MKFPLIIKFISVFAAITVLLYIFLARIFSVFRKPLYLTLPLSFVKIIILLCFVFIFVLMLFFLLKKEKETTNIILIKMKKLGQIIYQPFFDLHNFLIQKVGFYGTFFNLLNNIIISYDILKYSSILIIFFLVIPYSIVFTVFIFDCLYHGYIFLTYKVLILLLLPLMGKLILYILISFVDNNLKRISDSLDFIEVEKDDKYFSNVFFSELSILDQGLYEVRIKQDNNKFGLMTVRELYCYYLLFKKNKHKLEQIKESFVFFQKFFSILRYTLCILLINYFLILNILY